MTARGHIDRALLSSALALGLLGVVMVYSSSSILAESRFGSHLHFLIRQMSWALISIVIAWGVTKLNLKRLAVYTPIALLATIFALGLVFLMPARNGAQRWLFLGPLTVQPAEFAKLFLIAYLAFSLSKPTRDLSQYKRLLVPYLPIIGVVLGLVLLQPDLGVVIVMGVTVIAMFFMAGAPLRYLAAACLPLGASAAALVFGFGYKIARVRDYIASLEAPLEGSYQIKQAILTLGAGGVFGAGLGDGRQKMFFLPYPHTDFIFAAMGEEIGFVGLCVALALIFTILYRGVKIAAAQPDRFGYLLASGITLSLFFNTAVNIGVVLSLLPTTGIPLPFISYGGSSLVSAALMIGVLLNLSQRRDGWLE